MYSKTFTITDKTKHKKMSLIIQFNDNQWVECTAIRISNFHVCVNIYLQMVLLYTETFFLLKLYEIHDRRNKTVII